MPFCCSSCRKRWVETKPKFSQFFFVGFSVSASSFVSIGKETMKYILNMKIKNLFGCCLLFPMLGMAQPRVADRLETYPAPGGVEMKQDFEVKVRVPGGEWQPVPTYAVKVDRVAQARHNVEKASLAYFDFSGKVEVKVKSLSARME